MNTDTQKPSEHAMRAANKLYDASFTQSSPLDYAHIVDQYAIAPAVAERDKRIAELEEALHAIAGTTMSQVASMEHGFYRCVGIAKAVLKPKKGQP